MSPGASVPARSYAKSNRELAAAFERYLIARGQSPTTIRAYKTAVLTLVESLGATSIAEVSRHTIRLHLGELHKKGLDSNTIRLRTAALRAFFKFIRLTGLTKYDPTLGLAHRKIPGRLQRVLTIKEVERLVGAAQDPFERAVVEVLYATGVRVSELVRIRLEDIDFADGRLGSIRVKSGKGNKDRVVLFGRKAAQAVRKYLAWRPSQTGYLFEAPARNGCIRKYGGYWRAWFYVDQVQHGIYLGSPANLPTKDDARKRFEQIAANIPGFCPTPPRTYTARAIDNVIHRLAHRAKLGRVHPHMIRRAFACHLLSGGANIRVIQDLLGHERLGTTALYTWLTASDLKKTHSKFHPHGGDNAKKK